MGEEFYSLLVELFTNDHNHYLTSDEIVSSGLASVGMFCACISLCFTLLWLRAKSVLVKKSLMVNMFALFFALVATQFIGHVIVLPDWMKLTVDYLSTTLGLLIAFLSIQRRHSTLSAIYEFKYTVGLLKTVNTLEQVDR